MLKFLHMGGYAMYVWPSYALTLAVIGLNIGWARRSLHRAQLEARRRLAHAHAIDPRAGFPTGGAAQVRTVADATAQSRAPERS